MSDELNQTLQAVRDTCSQIVELLSHPQLGLATWNGILRRRLDQLRIIMEWPEALPGWTANPLEDGWYWNWNRYGESVGNGPSVVRFQRGIHIPKGIYCGPLRCPPITDADKAKEPAR